MHFKNKNILFEIFNYIYTLLVCLGVCTFVFNKYQICLTCPVQFFQKLASNKIRFTLKVENPRHFFIKTFLFCFTMYSKRKCLIKIEYGHEAPLKPRNDQDCSILNKAHSITIFIFMHFKKKNY